MSVMGLFSLSGRVALVTGGAGRYGQIISEALAEAGALVLVASRDTDRCAAFVEELRKAGHSAEAVTLDLARPDSIDRMWDEIRSRWGRVDVLFNNAVARAGAHFDRMTPGDWDTTLAVNARGLFWICRVVGLDMARRQAGTIVNVASIHGVVAPDFDIYGSTGWTSPANYAFEKGGMVQFTRYLASLRGAHRVRVNCLSPGGLDAETMPDEFVANYSRRTLLGRLARAADIKGVAVFLAADASAYITGQNIVVDGGYSVR
jgi:NAD(P)-dependent dehydrogenase (short-subunit alcohol dehydrogenase family)